jgi:toxin FitB
MILLDTNVLSALMAAAPDGSVIAWLDREPRLSIWTSSVSLFEVAYGLRLLPAGRRRQQLEEAFQALVTEILENRVSAFDANAAQQAAGFAASRRSLGRPVEFRDSMIAGIALATGATLATRNTRDFEQAGVALIDPWLAVKP